MARRAISQMASLPGEFIGATGSRYRFKELLQQRPHFGRVWLATYAASKFLYLASRLSLTITSDIKPDNMMVDMRHEEQDDIIDKVQITDLENAAYLPPGRCIRGMLAGNYNWRSPEAHFKERLNKPTDMFSFGITCICAILGRVIFGPDEDFRRHQAQGVLPTLIRLQRQVSYFGDQEGIDGLLQHISDDDVSCEVLQMMWDERFDENIPYKAFNDWPEVSDAEFKDFIKGLTSLAPSRRVTAKQALDHPWLAGL
ncbi:hypothetical protein Plec18167_006965 [Paecilomyces lecythidis]|uniref:Protein kinase domain-containing protein n=1 Tax=Paecilomyces lecythidis TaxID=3004212 RepID=A0ABR3X829_9EURO